MDDKFKRESKEIVSKLTKDKNNLDAEKAKKLEKDIADALFLQSILGIKI